MDLQSTPTNLSPLHLQGREEYRLPSKAWRSTKRDGDRHGTALTSRGLVQVQFVGGGLLDPVLPELDSSAQVFLLHLHEQDLMMYLHLDHH